MRYLIPLFLFLFSNSIPAQDFVYVKAETSNCDDKSLGLYTFDGFSITPSAEMTYESREPAFKVPASGHRFYYLGTSPVQPVPVILGAERGVTLSIACDPSLTLTVLNSAINDQYSEFTEDINRLRRSYGNAVTDYRQNQYNPEEKEKAVAKLREVAGQQLQLLDSLRSRNPFLAAMAALSTYLNYLTHGEDRYDNEVEYYSREFFRYVDWKNPVYTDLPLVFQKFREYTHVLASVHKDEDPFISAVDPTVSEIPEGGTKKLALGGIISVLRSESHPALEYYAEHFAEHYGDEHAEVVADLRSEIERTKQTSVGGIPPDFEQLNPQGRSVRLSDFRGKIVLIDFWASWSGISVREFPKLKRLYNTYHEQGFEILGVSLDRSKERWLNFIQDENLEWPNVSDLEGWENEVVLQYGVKSIPHRILVDENGKIIDVNGDLEYILAEIFGGG